MDLITRSGKYEVVKYRKEHLADLAVDIETREMIDFVGADVMGASLQTNGPAFSAFHDGHLFVVAGINILWEGSGEAWAMFGPSFREHGFFIHRTTFRFINRLSDDLKLERLQAVVMKGHYAGIQWINRLGFAYEGEMEKYFNGKTYLRYAKIY